MKEVSRQCTTGAVKRGRKCRERRNSQPEVPAIQRGKGDVTTLRKTSRGRNFLSDFTKAIALNLRQAFGAPGIASECSARRKDSALRIRSAHIQTLRKRNSGDRQRGEFPTSGAEGRGDSLGRRKLPSAASLGSQFTFARFSQGLPIFRSECLPDVTPAQA